MGKDKKIAGDNDQQLETLVDSVSQLPTQPLADSVAFYADSLFSNQPNLNRTIGQKDFEVIKQAANNGFIAVKTARRIFADNTIDINCNTKNVSLTYPKGVIPVVYYPFTKKDFDEFAICIGDPGHCQSASLFFFKQNKIIAKHDGYLRFGAQPKHYKDEGGRTVVYYEHPFTWGSGIWWNNYFFYKYFGDTLLPILNELSSGNAQQFWGFRTHELESSIQKTNPLTLKMVYYVEFADSTKPDLRLRIIDDSTTIKYVWNAQTKKLEGQYQNSKLSKPQILSYFVQDNDLLFINTYYKTLKSLLLDTANTKTTLEYLRHVKKYYEQRK